MPPAEPRVLIAALGFPADRAEIIHAFIGGSALHGVKLRGTDDTDVYGIFIEKPWLALGIGSMEHFTASTSPQDRRNVASDTDVMCYSLRKWAGLAAKGNPTLLHSLFTPAGPGEEEWSTILERRQIFLARTHAKKYMAYADAQLKRMTGLRGTGKHGQRPEIIGKFGYDSKAAMHTLRLLYEGIELMRDHWVTLPRPSKERELLLAVRGGEWSEERVIEHANRLLLVLEESSRASTLPATVDSASISVLVSELYLRNWAKL
ncbi:MAG TPA: nucleotidyltransferase domain-containing protein [Terriglobia bacterium]|nr:nucleotidyltransferase domain-containing protein [Terriglobia bacterium]